MQIKRYVILFLAAVLIMKVLNFRLVDYTTPDFKKQCAPMQTEEFLTDYELKAFLLVWSEYVRSGEKKAASDKISLLPGDIDESLPLNVKIWLSRRCWEGGRFFYVEQRLQAIINTVRLKKHTEGVKNVLSDLLQTETNEAKINDYENMIAMQDKIANIENVSDDEIALVRGHEDEFSDILSGKIPYKYKNQ